MPQHTGTYSTPRLDLGEALVEYPMNQAGFVGSQILPIFETPKKTGEFVAVSRESILRGRNVVRAPKSAYARDDHELTPVSFTCVEYGYEQVVDDSERAYYASDYDADETAAMLARDVLLREYEKRVASEIFNTTTFTGAALYTDLGTDWDNAASTIVADVEAAKQQIRTNCGLMPNTMVFGAGVVPWLKANTDLKSRLQYVQALTDEAIMSSLPQIFGVQRVLIGGGVKNTANEGATYSGSDIWDDNYCWLGVCGLTGRLNEPCVGRTMAWTGDGGAFTVDQYREEQTRGDVIRVRQYVDEKIFDAYFGHLLKIDT